MAWQDELRRLDEEWAAGRISADDYRRRFDELTAQAGTVQPPEPDSTAQTDRTPKQANPPDNGSGPADQGSPPEQDDTPGKGAQNSPFPPAFRWDSTPTESTQVINPAGGGDAESTQIVPTQPPPVLPSTTLSAPRWSRPGRHHLRATASPPTGATGSRIPTTSGPSRSPRRRGCRRTRSGSLAPAG